MLTAPGEDTDYLKGQINALPNGMQVVPIHTVPMTEDTLLRAYSSSVCPVNTLWTDELIQTETYKEHTASIKQSIKWVEDTFKVQLNSSHDIPGEVLKVYDNYLADKF